MAVVKPTAKLVSIIKYKAVFYSLEFFTNVHLYHQEGYLKRVIYTV